MYSKRSRNWRVQAVKEEKSYSYWPKLLADILHKRAEDKDLVSRHVQLSATNPQHLAPTIAMKAAPSTKELVDAKRSRFKKFKTDHSD